MRSEAPANRAASVRQRLLNIAKERGGRLQLRPPWYGLERLLFRLGQGRHAGTFVLKAAMLFPLWSGSPHRATKDMDLLGSGSPDLEKSLLSPFPEAASAACYQATATRSRASSKRSP